MKTFQSKIKIQNFSGKFSIDGVHYYHDKFNKKFYCVNFDDGFDYSIVEISKSEYDELSDEEL